MLLIKGTVIELRELYLDAKEIFVRLTVLYQSNEYQYNYLKEKLMLYLSGSAECENDEQVIKENYGQLPINYGRKTFIMIYPPIGTVTDNFPEMYSTNVLDQVQDQLQFSTTEFSNSESAKVFSAYTMLSCLTSNSDYNTIVFYDITEKNDKCVYSDMM